jgi:cell division protein ZapA
MKSTKIEIFGQYYNIKGDMSDEYIDQLAIYVDKKMKMIADQSPMLDTMKLAILACLNIADELFTLKKAIEDKNKELERRADEILKSIDNYLREENKIKEGGE